MNNKIVILILSVLFVLSTSASTVGLIEHNKKNEEPDNTPKKETNIIYEYYLDDNLLNEAPKDEEDEEGNKIYEFSKYQCDNNVTGTFDEEKWSFIPDEVKTSTCKLYFVKKYYDVDLTASNGTLDKSNPEKVERETDATFKLIPNEGYEFSEITCANNKQIEYDKDNNEIKINAITEDVACKIDFELKELKIDLTCKNCNEKTSEIYPTERKNYGDSIAFIVTPNAEYKFKSEKNLTCTNDQKAIFDEKNNTLTIEKLTNDTSCNITFEKQIITHQFTLELENVTLLKDTTERKVLDKQSVEVIIKANEGYEITEENKDKSVNCGGLKPEVTITSDGIIYKFTSITSDTSCKISSTKLPEQESTE